MNARRSQPKTKNGRENTKKKKIDKKKKTKAIKTAAAAAESKAPCVFPMSRVRRLVRGEGGNADARTTQDAIFLINKAAEMFLKKYTEDAYANTGRGWKRGIDYSHLSSSVCNGNKYEFLSDFVPEKVRAKDALKAAKALAEP